MGLMGLRHPLDIYSIQIPENTDDVRKRSADEMRFEKKITMNYSNLKTLQWIISSSNGYFMIDYKEKYNEIEEV